MHILLLFTNFVDYTIKINKKFLFFICFAFLKFEIISRYILIINIIFIFKNGKIQTFINNQIHI